MNSRKIIDPISSPNIEPAISLKGFLFVSYIYYITIAYMVHHSYQAYQKQVHHLEMHQRIAERYMS